MLTHLQAYITWQNQYLFYLQEDEYGVKVLRRGIQAGNNKQHSTTYKLTKMLSKRLYVFPVVMALYLPATFIITSVWKETLNLVLLGGGVVCVGGWYLWLMASNVHCNFKFIALYLSHHIYYSLFHSFQRYAMAVHYDHVEPVFHYIS